MCCDRQASALTLSLGVTVRDSSRKMLVLLGLAGRKFREILEHGVRRVASQGNLGDFQEARAQEGQKSAPQGKCKAWVLEIARVSFEFAGVKRSAPRPTGNARFGFWKSREYH